MTQFYSQKSGAQNRDGHQFTFDRAIHSEFSLEKSRQGCSIYQGLLDKDWVIGQVPHGGYLTSILLNAFQHHFKDTAARHPIYINVHFLNKARVGPYQIEISDIKRSKAHPIAYAILRQKVDLTAPDDEGTERYIECIRATTIFADMEAERGFSFPLYDAVPIPPQAECVAQDPAKGASLIAKHIKIDVDPKTPEKKRPELKQYISFRDGRPLDLVCLGFLSDMFSPPVQNVGLEALGGDSWYPTMTLEIQLKSIPKGQWLGASFRGRFLMNGRNELDGELWDEEKNLVAITRHMCLVVPWEVNTPKAVLKSSL